MKPLQLTIEQSKFTSDDPISQSIILSILNAKRIIVICGAGISVAAGIPDFGSKQPIQELSEMPPTKLKDMFHISMLLGQRDRTRFCRLMATLWKISSEARPTKFHHLLKALSDRGSLLRVYTQNIDGLESKVGLNIDISHPHHPPPTCIPLHGQLEKIRCQGCNSTELIEAHYQTLMLGQLPSCRLCQETQIGRQNCGKRRRSIPVMIPDVLLYGQEHPAGEYISVIQRQDACYADLLLVVGTSMKVRGAASAIKGFAKNIHHAPSPDLSFSTIYLNKEFHAQKAWSSVFDAWIRVDCQAIASVILEKLEPNGIGSGSGISDDMLAQDLNLVPKPDDSEFMPSYPRNHSIGNAGEQTVSISDILQFHMGLVEEIARKNPNTAIQPYLALLRSSIAGNSNGPELVNYHFCNAQEQVGDDENLKLALRLVGVCLQMSYGRRRIVVQ